jgi:putative ABC transport system permease protein
MKYLPLIWFGIWRKPVRTILIVLQVAVAFALFGVLQGMKTGVELAVAHSRADLLMVSQASSSGSRLPAAYVDRIRLIPGVKVAAFLDALNGTYQKPTQQVNVLAVENSDAWPMIMADLIAILPKDLHALQNTRTGALISAEIAKKYGWRVGDRIPLHSATLRRNGSGDWVFDIVGTFDPHLFGNGNMIMANYDYLDGARTVNQSTVGNFFVVVSDPKQAAAVSGAIDRTFTNSSSQTLTSSFKERAQLQMRAIGDLEFAIRSIVSAVLVALLFSTGTMLMQTLRERTPDLAVLKTLGFTDGGVFLLVVVEALAVCVLAALIGLGLATMVFPYAAKFIPGLSMPMVVVGIGLGAAVLIALISVAVPASKAAKLQVADALADR